MTEMKLPMPRFEDAEGFRRRKRVHSGVLDMLGVAGKPVQEPSYTLIRHNYEYGGLGMSEHSAMLAHSDTIIRNPKWLHSLTLLEPVQFDYLCYKVQLWIEESGKGRLFWDDRNRRSDPGNRCKLYVRHFLLLALASMKSGDTEEKLAATFLISQSTVNRYLKLADVALSDVLPTAGNITEVIKSVYNMYKQETKEQAGTAAAKQAAEPAKAKPEARPAEPKPAETKPVPKPAAEPAAEPAEKDKEQAGTVAAKQAAEPAAEPAEKDKEQAGTVAAKQAAEPAAEPAEKDKEQAGTETIETMMSSILPWEVLDPKILLAREHSLFPTIIGAPACPGGAVPAFLHGPELSCTGQLNMCPMLLLDGAHMSIARSGDPDQRAMDYSGKKKAFTRNTIIITSPDGLILWISKSVPGSTHDLTLLKDNMPDFGSLTDMMSQEGAPESGCTNLMMNNGPPNASFLIGLASRQPVIVVDKGLKGVEKVYPGAYIMIPTKRNMGSDCETGRLSQADKDYNTEVSRIRIKVEHAIGKIKEYWIMRRPFNGTPEELNVKINVVTGLVNLKHMWKDIARRDAELIEELTAWRKR